MKTDKYCPPEEPDRMELLFEKEPEGGYTVSSQVTENHGLVSWGEDVIDALEQTKDAYRCLMGLEEDDPTISGWNETIMFAVKFWGTTIVLGVTVGVLLGIISDCFL